MPTPHALLLGLAVALAPAAPVQEPPVPDAGAQDREQGSIEWFEGTWDEALALARAEGRLVFVDFWTSWCGYCKKLERTTFRDAGVAKAMRDLVCVSVDAEAPGNRALVRELAPRSYPTLCFVEPDGELRETLVGYHDPARFVEEVRRVKRDEGTLGQLRRRIAEEPADVEARYALARKLEHLGDLVGYRRQVDAIREHDPEGRSVPSRHLALEEIRRHAQETLRPEELYAFLAEETEPSILFDGWYAVWQLEQYLEKVARQAAERSEHRRRKFAAARALWPVVAAESPHYVALGSAIAASFHEGRAYLGTQDLAWALEVARAVVRAEPEDPAARDVLARSLWASGDVEGAVREIHRAIELDPRNPRWRERLAEIAADAGER